MSLLNRLAVWKLMADLHRRSDAIYVYVYIFYSKKKYYHFFFLVNLLFIKKQLYYFYSFIKYVGYECDKIYDSIRHNSVRNTYKITAGQGYAIMLINTILAV